MTFPNEVEYVALWGMIHVHDEIIQKLETECIIVWQTFWGFKLMIVDVFGILSDFCFFVCFKGGLTLSLPDNSDCIYRVPSCRGKQTP